MRFFFFALTWLTISTLFAAACTSNSNPSASLNPGPTTTPTSTSTTPPTIVDSGSRDAAPVQLPSTPDACPDGFKTSLSAGQQSNFLSATQERSFDLVLPPASFTGPRPLLFAFHGTGLSGAQIVSIYGLADWVSAGFIVVAPDSNGNGSIWPVWDALQPPGAPAHTNADLALFDDLLKCVAGHYSVDAKRIYVAGQSAGGAMSNFMLGQRSSVLAGGVPASGAFDFTQTTPKIPVDPITVIVTWGGDNDFYTGGTGDVSIDNIGYAEQSSLASQYWESQSGSHQVACKGNNLGHNWLNTINLWMRDFLLAHPKGSAVIPGEMFPPLPAGAQATCSEAAYIYQPTVTVSCATSATAGCQAYCQLLGDCFVENGTLGPVMETQLQDIGFASTANVCTGCLTNCQQDAKGSASDATLLGCVSAAAPSNTCGPGFAGTDAFGIVGNCCKASNGSQICNRFCTTFEKSSYLKSLLVGCP